MSHSRHSSITAPAPTSTNTISVTGLPKSFFHPLVLEALSSHFATFGEINQWVPLHGFGRIIIVYKHEEHAETAKVQSDPILIEAHDDRPETKLRVYRADPSPILDENSLPDYLHAPAIEKNFLISPPGSPPVGWEQIREEPPNATPLADDLVAALRKLQLKSKPIEGGLEILLDPSDGGVGVYVEDCDGGEDGGRVDVEDEWVYGQTAPARDKWKAIPTALPPIKASVI